MGRAGRPRKQKAWKPGAPPPIPAAGCGPERHLTVQRPKRSGNGLQFTPTGWAQDLLGTWHHRRKKRSSETIIDDRQYLAGRTVEHMIGKIAGRGMGKLRAIDLSLPVVDQSFSHRLGGDQAFHDAMAMAIRLGKALGPRDFFFMTNVLLGMGVHGALLHEAGLPWRTEGGSVSDAVGILGRGFAYKITPVFADPANEIAGSFGVEDRKDLEARGLAGKIDPENRFKVPHDLGFEEDQATVIEDRTKAAARNRVMNSRADIDREALRDKLQDLRGLKVEELEEAGDIFTVMENAEQAIRDRRVEYDGADGQAIEAADRRMKHDPPPDARGHGEGGMGDMNSIGSTISFDELVEANKSMKERAVDAFGERGIEVGSVRARELLNKIADFLETDEQTSQYDTTAQITQGTDVPIDTVIKYEDAVYVEV